MFFATFLFWTVVQVLMTVERSKGQLITSSAPDTVSTSNADWNLYYPGCPCTSNAIKTETGFTSTEQCAEFCSEVHRAAFLEVDHGNGDCLCKASCPGVESPYNDHCFVYQSFEKTGTEATEGPTGDGKRYRKPGATSPLEEAITSSEEVEAWSHNEASSENVD